MTTTITLGDALGFIATQATEADLDTFYSALRTRQKALGRQRAAAVGVGTTVTLVGISPKYLAGMTGTITATNGNSASVRLDAASTRVLAVKGARRFYIPPGVTDYEIHGVPLSTCQVVA